MNENVMSSRNTFVSTFDVANSTTVITNENLCETKSLTTKKNKNWNEFNRKNLFTQRVRRMHEFDKSIFHVDKVAFETTLKQIKIRCWRQLRSASWSSICGFCVHKQYIHYNKTSLFRQFEPVMFERKWRGKNAWIIYSDSWTYNCWK